MNLYVMDTDTVSLYQHGHPRVCAAVNAQAAGEVVITVMTIEEQLSGWYSELRRARTPAKLAGIYQRMANTVRFYSSLPILSFSEPAIAQYQSLQRQKINIGKSDLRIAAIALEQNDTVVTRNTKDFQRVPGLRIENWTI